MRSGPGKRVRARRRAARAMVMFPGRALCSELRFILGQAAAGSRAESGSVSA